ncbi:MAG: Maf family protein [Promethearchaeota archaeon]
MDEVRVVRLVLASKSRDRREILERAGFRFEVRESGFEEVFEAGEDPVALVKRLARGKVEAVASRLRGELGVSESKERNTIVVGADTVVTHRGRVIGKAKGEAEAFGILKALAGETHDLVTGIAVHHLETGEWFVEADTTRVTFAKLSDGDIWAYIRGSDEFIGRAGAYSIRDRAALFVTRVEGSPSNVIGLPMHLLAEALREFGIDPLSREYIEAK